jgi:hypothetical protein
MSKKLQSVLVLIAALLVSGLGGANAQTYTLGSIAGTVFDASGAVVPGASVTLHNDGTNSELVLKTDGSGYFKAPELNPANYTVTIDAAGFAPYKELSVVVLVGQTTELLAHLAAAGSTTSVEVTAEAPILNFESPDISTVLTAHNIEDLPMNGERWSNLTLLTPAATVDTSGFGLISFRAISTLLNNVEVDGADDNQAYYSEERGRTREGYSTSKFSIQEFQVNTGVYSAEFGRAAGGVINAVTKSGTNNIHGVAFFSDRDNDWGAYNAFTTNTINTAAAGSAPSFVTTPYKPVDWRKEWGFDAGGALKKDKIFWFYGYNQYHRNFPGTAKANTPSSFFTLPDAALPSGATCNYTDVMNGAKIVDGAGYVSVPTGGTAVSTQDQMACSLAVRLNAAGLPGYTTYAGGATAYSNQLVNLLTDLGSVPRQGFEELNTPKLDWQVNDKNHVSVLYHRLRWDSPGGVQTQATNQYAIDSFGEDFVKLDYGLVKLDSLITSNITNEVRYQYGRELDDEGQQPLSAYSKANLTATNSNVATGGGFSPNVTEVALDTSIGMYLGSLYYDYRKALPDERKWQVGDTATWQKGNHSIKFGLDLIHNDDLINNTFESEGVYTYSYIGNYFADVLSEGTATGVCNATGTVSAPGTATTDYTGTATCATMVQGFGPPVWEIATTDYGFFGEDHWKLTPKLTVDFGLRYDFEAFPAPYSALTTASGSFVPYLASSGGLCAAYTGSGTCPTLASKANITNQPDDKTDFGPRIGLALDPFGDGKTTIRAGAGIFVGRTNNGMILNTYLNTGSPAGQYVSATVKPTATSTAAANSAFPKFPNIIASAGGSTPTSYFYSSNFKNPEVYEFDAAIQRALGHNAVLQVSYMGALGRRLPNALNINYNPNPNTAGATCGTNGTTVCPPNGVVTSVVTVSDASGTGPIPSGTVFNVPTYTGFINPAFGPVDEAFSNISSSYNAGVIEVENKTDKHFQYDVNYTYSHALDYNENASTNNLSNGWIDPYNIDGFKRGGNYGNSQWNVPDRLVAWALFNSPDIEKAGWAKLFVNDWSLAPMFQAQNGLPYSAGFQSGSVSTSAYSSGINGGGVSSWIPFIGHNNYSMRRIMVADVRLEKVLDFGPEGHAMKLHLIGEAFNVSNHENVTSVQTSAYTLSANSNVTSGCSGSQLVSGQTQDECSTMTFVPEAGAGHAASGFKAITNTNSDYVYTPRQVQLALRLDF